MKPPLFRSIGLIVGNGLTYDFVSGVGPGIGVLNPALPLWNFKCDSISYSSFIDKLPEVRDHLVGPRAVFRNDFVAMGSFVPPQASEWNQARYDCQLRRFLALAYSLYQAELDKYPVDRWRWTGWLRQYRNCIDTVVSFNYDLVIERALLSADLMPHRIGTPETGKVPVFKPHGSLDFEFPSGAIGFGSEDDVWNNYFTLNDGGGVQVLSKAEWLRPRIQPDLVPPSYQNYQLGLRWVRGGYEYYQQRSRNLDCVVVVGFSYQGVDRPEFDYMMEQIPRVPVFVIDPNPSEALLAKLCSVGHEVHRQGTALPQL